MKVGDLVKYREGLIDYFGLVMRMPRPYCRDCWCAFPSGIGPNGPVGETKLWIRKEDLKVISESR